MPPLVESDSARSRLTVSTHDEPEIMEPEIVEKYEAPIVWINIVKLGLLHLAALYGCYLALSLQCGWRLWVLTYFIGQLNALGMTAGAHRLWAHRAYKAKVPLRIFLIMLNCLAFQTDIYDWVRDHRVHHKYTETEADPHNAARGFFFSHVGWLLCRKHPEVTRKGRNIDLSDILNDPVIKFQRKYYYWLVLLLCFTVPTLAGMYVAGDSAWNSFFLCGVVRYVSSLHLTWLVNSAAHMYGNRPYDKKLSPTENLWVTFGAVGEGFHNYHHTFPWDYAASELGTKYNLTTYFINFMEYIGQAYDLKRVSPEMVKNRALKHGDGTHPIYHEHDHHY